MKKTVRKSAPKTVKRASRTHSAPSAENFVLFRRVVLIVSCLVLLVVVSADVSKKGVTQSVAGISIAKGLFAQTTVTLPRVDGAVSYNIYYKELSEGRFIHAVRSVPASTTTYTISYLKKAKKYHYKISALDASGKEFWWSKVSGVAKLTSL